MDMLEIKEKIPVHIYRLMLNDVYSTRYKKIIMINNVDVPL